MSKQTLGIIIGVISVVMYITVHIVKVRLLKSVSKGEE